MKYSISQKTQPRTHQHRFCMAPKRQHDSDYFGVHVSVLSVTYILWTWGSPQIRPKKAKKNLKRCISTTEKVVFQTHLQDPWVLTYQPWVIGSHRRCFLGDSWFPDVKSGGRKHLLTREIGLESAGASDQHHVPEYGGRHLASRFQGFLPIGGSCLPERSQSTWGSQEETGQKKSKCLSGDHWVFPPIDAGERWLQNFGEMSQKKHVSCLCHVSETNACNWRSCWNVNELQKRWCEISDGWNVLKYHCNLKFARFPPERAHLFRYTLDCCSCDLRQDEDDAGPQSYKQKQEGKPGSDMFWPGVAMCSLKITWERLIIIHTGMPMAWPQMKIISKTIWSFNLWQSRDAPNLYWFFWVMSCFPFFHDFSSILTSETAFPLFDEHTSAATAS